MKMSNLLIFAAIIFNAVYLSHQYDFHNGYEKNLPEPRFALPAQLPYPPPQHEENPHYGVSGARPTTYTPPLSTNRRYSNPNIGPRQNLQKIPRFSYMVPQIIYRPQPIPYLIMDHTYGQQTDYNRGYDIHRDMVDGIIGSDGRCSCDCGRDRFPSSSGGHFASTYYADPSSPGPEVYAGVPPQDSYEVYRPEQYSVGQGFAEGAPKANHLQHDQPALPYDNIYENPTDDRYQSEDSESDYNQLDSESDQDDFSSQSGYGPGLSLPIPSLEHSSGEPTVLQDVLEKMKRQSAERRKESISGNSQSLGNDEPLKLPSLRPAKASYSDQRLSRKPLEYQAEGLETNDESHAFRLPALPSTPESLQKSQEMQETSYSQNYAQSSNLLSDSQQGRQRYKIRITTSPSSQNQKISPKIFPETNLGGSTPAQGISDGSNNLDSANAKVDSDWTKISGSPSIFRSNPKTQSSEDTSKKENKYNFLKPLPKLAPL